MEYLSIVAAAAAAFIFGAVWYTALGKQYQRALARTRSSARARKCP